MGMTRATGPDSVERQTRNWGIKVARILGTNVSVGSILAINRSHPVETSPGWGSVDRSASVVPRDSPRAIQLISCHLPA